MPPSGPQSPELCDTTFGAAPFPEAVIRVVRVQMPLPEQIARIPRGALLICTANVFAEADAVSKLAEAGIDCVAMELLPRPF